MSAAGSISPEVSNGMLCHWLSHLFHGRPGQCCHKLSGGWLTCWHRVEQPCLQKYLHKAEPHVQTEKCFSRANDRPVRLGQSVAGFHHSVAFDGSYNPAIWFWPSLMDVMCAELLPHRQRLLCCKSTQVGLGVLRRVWTWDGPNNVPHSK